LAQCGCIAGAAGNAGLTPFTRAIGGTSPEFGVRVVGVNPGPVQTDRIETLSRKRAAALYGDENRWRETFAKMPFGRPATTDEIAAMVVFLASAFPRIRAARSSPSTAASPIAASRRCWLSARLKSVSEAKWKWGWPAKLVESVEK
jgi:NAD(P)-dependent dehydrogenase (short-subunit alcohol dehydrogenase family)